ncbi:uncharacterized protein LOC144139518 [Haemaphysalis longicornis]
MPFLLKIVDSFFANSADTPSDVVYENTVCKGEIKFAFPGSWAECIGQTLMVCENGKPVNISMVMSLVSSTGCILNEILTSDPEETMEEIFCSFVDAAEVFFSIIPGSKILYDLFLGNICE